MTESLGILHLTTFLQGGAGRAIADLACAQRTAGHSVTVVTSETGAPGYGNYPEYVDRLLGAQVAVYRCDSLFKRDEALNRNVLALLQRQVAVAAIDIVHAHAAVPATIGRRFADAGARRVPVVQTQHGWGTSKTATQAASDVDVLRAVDRVITTSVATHDLIVGYGVPRESVEVIPCGLEPRSPLTARRAEEMIAPLRGAATVIGCVGTVNANKNQRLIIDALCLVGDLDIVVVFLGEGGEALIDHAAAAGVSKFVHAVGHQPDASRWLPLFDLLVSPSRSEGQGLVVLEAFRAGVPVVASDIPAFAHLIQDGSNGFLFRNDDAQDLAATIRKAVTLKAAAREAIVTRGYDTFAADYTLDRMIARHEALYRRLVSHQSGGLCQLAEYPA